MGIAAVTLAIGGMGLIARAAQTTAQTAAEDALTRKARAIHERVMTLDTHNDINPENFTAERNYTQDLGNQVNLPKMFKGGLDASFFIVYVGQDRTDTAFTPAGYDRAYKQAIQKFDAIHRLCEQIAPDKIGLALTSADARRIYASGRKVAFIGVENGYPLGEDHIDYAVKLIGIDHVGISSDFDGGGGVDGWNGADETFNVTLELVRRGYTELQIAKLWSGNVLRVLDEVQAVSRKLQN